MVNVFENFRKLYLDNNGFAPYNSYSTPGLTCLCGLKNSNAQ